MGDWIAAVSEFLRDIERAEENAWMNPRRKRCPFCGTMARHDDDGSWWHEDYCVAYNAHHLLMTQPRDAA